MRIYLLLLLLTVTTWGQASRLIFDRITMDSGLSSSHVTSILQDRTGYVWIGTAEGLNRFDGYTFKTFLPDPDDPESIQGSSIDRLFEDSGGAIWIFFSSGEISRYDPASDSFLNFTREWLRQQLRVYGNPTCFSASVGGHLYIGTENGLLEYDEREKRLVRLPQASSFVSSSPVNCLYMAPDGTFWVGTLAGFSSYDRQRNRFEDFTIRTNDDADINAGNLNGVSAIYVDRYNYMWLGTGREGAFRSVDAGEREMFRLVGRKDSRVYQFLETRGGDFWIGHDKGASRIDRMSRVALRCEHFFDQPEDLAPTGECHVRAMLESKDGTVWFHDSRFNQGLFFYSPATRSVGRLRNVPEDRHSISSNQVTCLYLDPSDHLWMGHSNYGVSHADLAPPLFRYTFGYTEKDNLSSNHILAVHEDSDLNLWVATSKGLDRINHQTSRIDKRYVFSPRKGPDSLSGKIIASLEEDSIRNLWVSYLDAHPDRLSLEDLKVRPLALDYRESYEPSVKYMAKIRTDRTGAIWFTTRDGGLIKYDPHSRKPYFYTQPSLIAGKGESSFPDLYSLCIDTDDWLWLGTDGYGLRSLDAETETFTDYRHSAGEANSIASDHVRCLFADSAGILWIGTNAGLDRYEKRTGRFEHFTVREGLRGNIVQGIREGEPGILYISTNRGLNRLDMHDRQIVNYSTANGLLSNEFIAGACCRRKSGELVFGSNTGLVSFDPRRLTADLRKVPQALRITNLVIGGSPGKQDLRVGFVAFDYSRPRSIRFRYRLDGYDTDWREADAGNRVALYNRLPPGDYVFRVETSGNGYYWSEPVTERVRIVPPWWRSGWFILFVLAGFCGFLYIIYKSRVRWYQLRQADLERKIEERTLLLKQAKQELEEKDELKTRFFMNVSHELRTPLTIIKGLTENLEQGSSDRDSVNEKETLRTIARNTNRLIRHVNELLDLSVLNRGVPSPHIVCADLGNFLKEITDTFIPLAETYSISFSCSIAPDLSVAYFDRNIIEQVLYNLLSNAFKYTPDGGCVNLSVYSDSSSCEQVVTLRIEDNGIGIPAEALPRIFDRYYKGESMAFRRSESSGIGLAYTKELLELHQGTITCESEPGKGSVFTVMLPVSEKAYPDDWVEHTECMEYANAPGQSVEGGVPDSILPEEARPILLFIEDNEDLCRYLQDSFHSDFRVVLAKNGKTGYEKALEILPDVIISDVMMPIMNGVECCEALKTDERTAHIPVILLTALAEERQQLEGYGAGADDYLPKPFSVSVLKAKIQNLIKRSEQLQIYFRDRFSLESPESSVMDPNKEFISKATQVVLANLQNPSFDVELFCSGMAMSRASLFRKLKSTTGCSASSFTRNIRIKRAADLLRQHAYTIGEVATLVGFSDPNYFTRCFKEIYGVTPSEFIHSSPNSPDSRSPLSSCGR